MKPEYVRLLADNAMRVAYNAGETIFSVGDPANRFYLIEHGRVALDSPRPKEAPLTVQVLEPGDVLGWSWLFPPYQWQFAARTLEPTTVVFFYGTRLREQCEQDPAFGFEMMKRMAQVVIKRLQATREELLSARQARSA